MFENRPQQQQQQQQQQNADQPGGNSQSSIGDSFFSRMQSEPDAVRMMLFDDALHGDDGSGGGSGGGSGSREDLMRLALQKKRWIEMQLHAVHTNFCHATCDL
jgi:hypothetical protein